MVIAAWSAIDHLPRLRIRKFFTRFTIDLITLGEGFYVLASDFPGLFQLLFLEAPSQT